MAADLGQELRQTRPFAGPEHEAYLNIVRTASVLNDALEQVLRPAGLTITQYNALRILRGAEPDGLCRNEVRDRMVSRMPDMTRLLDRMEAAGLVQRARSETDRRVVSTRITQQGLDVLASLDEAVTAEHQRRLGHLGRDALRTLIRLLGTVRERA